MTSTLRKPSRLWIGALVAALALLVGMNVMRVSHAQALTRLGGWEESRAAGEMWGTGNSLIVPLHHNDSYQWLILTQRMFARGEWRVRHIEYENAPFGREVAATSPYRWWLGASAWIDHVFSGQPIARSVERAALVADPILHALLLIGATLLVARRFGSLAAGLTPLLLVAIFPLAGEYLPGAPDDHGFVQLWILGSLLTLVGGVGETEPSARRWFAASGVLGAIALWSSASNTFPILAGMWLAGFFATWLGRPSSKPLAKNAAPKPDERETYPLPWRSWGLAGAITTLVAYLIEYAPDHLGEWQLKSTHPIYGVVWLGMAELLARVGGWVEQKRRWRWTDYTAVVLSLLAIAALPIALWRTHSSGFLTTDLSAFRLTKLSRETATSAWLWLQREGAGQHWATLLPIVTLAGAVVLVFRRQIDSDLRRALVLALGPALVALAFASRQLSWWTTVDVTLVTLLAIGVAALARSAQPTAARWCCSAMAGVFVVFGFIQVWPAKLPVSASLHESEMFALIERDMAGWLAKRVGDKEGVALAPPDQTATLYFYGGIRGLGTLSWENKSGLEVAVRLLSASTPEEAKELIDRRGVTHIIIPTWDNYLDEYARMGMGQLGGTFLERLHAWKLTPWLRPIPYQLPTISGFEGQAVTIFEVVEDQEDAPAFARFVEYFVEMNQLDNAAAAAQSLRRFPFDLGALVARAEVEQARGDAAAFGKTIDSIKARLVGKADRTLPWDRRVSLAVVLAQAKQNDLAKEQVKRCYADLDEPKLRFLTPVSLWRLQVLGKAFGFSVSDPKLRELAIELLPVEYRKNLGFGI